MRRMELMELHDHRRFPAFLRDLVTDALETLWGVGNSYKPILPQLHAALCATGDGRSSDFAVIDLCSGGGGPWSKLAREFATEYGVALRICLTDKYPSQEAAKRVQGDAKVRYLAQPVDALQVPEDLGGLRTMFSSFHHFGPSDARAVLRDAVQHRRGIGIFEVPRRGLKTLLTIFITPLLVIALTPWIRPFQWSRLIWTYLIPVVPFVIWFDGCMSCFRAYSGEELREMVREEREDSYRWEIGEARGGLLPVTYLIGWPVSQGPIESPSFGETSKQPHEVY